MPEDIEQKYVIHRPDARQIDMEALTPEPEGAPPAEIPDDVLRSVEAAPDVAAVEERNIRAILDLLIRAIEDEFGPVARIRVENLGEDAIRRLIVGSLPQTLPLDDPDFAGELGAGASAQTLADLRGLLARIVEYAFPDPDAIHTEATVVDVHAHPGLKALWFRRRLADPHMKVNLIQRLTHSTPVAFDPFAVRTCFPKLRAGRVNVLFSTIYALEMETLFDLQVLGILPRPEFLSRDIVRRIKRLPWIGIVAGLLLAAVFGWLAWLAFAAAGGGWLIALGVAAALVSLGLLAGAIGLLVVHTSWILPVLVARVLGPEYFDIVADNIGEVERQVKEAREAGEMDVQVARSVEELEDGLQRINAAKSQNGGDGQGPGEPLILIHSLEGAHCLHGSAASGRLAAIKRKAQAGGDTTADSQALQRDTEVEDEVMGNLMALYRSGVAMIGLSHYYPNVVCQSVFSYPERAASLINPGRWEFNWHDVSLGLTRLGTKVIEEMLRLGIVIDITHTSPTTRRDVYDLVDAYDGGAGKRCAVAASHIGVQGVHRHPYNLADWEIAWLAEHGGVIGVMWSNFWLSGHEGLKLGLGYITRTIDHIFDVLGEDAGHVVGFGSDLDGFSDPPDDLWDATRWPVLTQYLASEYTLDAAGHTWRKYTPEQIRAFLGGNMLALIRSGWGRKTDDTRADLIAQLGSLNNRLALDAAADLRARGWLADGSLDGASLRGANLAGADLAGADLRGVDLSGANLQNADLQGAQFDERTIMPDGMRWTPG